MNLLFISDEIAPLGGASAESAAVGHLGGALAALGHQVTAIVPLRDPDVIQRYSLARRLSPLKVELPDGEHSVFVYDGRLPSGVVVRLLEHDRLVASPSDADAPLRIGLFARAALALAGGDVDEGAVWHVIHGFSTAGALALHLAQLDPRLDQVRTVLSVGDLDGRLRCDKEWVDRLGLSWDDFSPEGFEFFGELDLLKAGLVTADRILFPGFGAAVIARTPDGGGGLDGLLRARREATAYLLPGLDYARWNPAVDAHLPVRFDAEQRDGKVSCKASLQNLAGLPIRPDAPLVACAPPLADLAAPLADVLDRVLRADAQIVAPRGLVESLETTLDALAAEWPRQIARLDLDEATLHLLVAGADLFVVDAPTDADAEMLLAASRYGALPIVANAGLASELVVDLTADLESGNGFLIPGPNPSGRDVLAVLQRALAAVRRRDRLPELLARTMAAPVSWAHRAQHLERIYGEALK